MLVISAILLLATAYPGDQPPSDLFSAACSGEETAFTDKTMDTRPWTQHLRIDLTNKRYCLGDCGAWRPIARIENSGVRLSDSDSENSFFSWRGGRLHYRWANVHLIHGPHISDRQGYCTLDPARR
jgi:hypothetical protein